MTAGPSSEKKLGATGKPAKALYPKSHPKSVFFAETS